MLVIDDVPLPPSPPGASPREEREGRPRSCTRISERGEGSAHDARDSPGDPSLV